MSRACSCLCVVGLLLTVGLTAASDLEAMLSFVSYFNSSCVDPSWTKATPVCQWAGVACSSGRVTTFGYSNQCGGLLHLHLLPPKLQNLSLGYNSFTGPVDLAACPPGLQVLSLELNFLTGTLNLTALPASLQTLSLADNQLEGGVRLSRLPPQLQVLDLSGNQLSGPLDLAHLPSSLAHVDLPGNNFCGTGGHSIPCANLWLPGECSCTDTPNQYICPPCS
jgi:hypothetical protein